MTGLEIIKQPEIHSILESLQRARHEQRLAGYNLFTISNQFQERENFHSDIIRSLLDPEGLHKEGYSQLKMFLEFLNVFHHTNLKFENYLNVSVLREQGKIDVLILDNTSRHAIIIENKINDAPDQENQLLNYYQHLTDRHYEVDAVIYLSKDGQKTAPTGFPLLGHLIHNIAAFNATSSDLLNGWLRPCGEMATNEDNRSFLRQYSKLIQHLSSKQMENNAKEEFYQYISSQKNSKPSIS